MEKNYESFFARNMIHNIVREAQSQLTDDTLYTKTNFGSYPKQNIAPMFQNIPAKTQNLAPTFTNCNK